jgi:hypothetical protein
MPLRHVRFGGDQGRYVPVGGATSRGGQWPGLPVDVPSWDTVYYYFRTWNRDGTLTRMHHGHCVQIRQALSHNPDPAPHRAQVCRATPARPGSPQSWPRPPSCSSSPCQGTDGSSGGGRTPSRRHAESTTDGIGLRTAEVKRQPTPKLECGRPVSPNSSLTAEAALCSVRLTCSGSVGEAFGRVTSGAGGRYARTGTATGNPAAAGGHGVPEA